MGLTYDLLVEYSPKDSSPVPGLADSWETSDDGLTWTFHLNKDAKWHDGKPVTSEDVAYTYPAHSGRGAGPVHRLRQADREHRDARQAHGRVQDRGTLGPDAEHVRLHPAQAHLGGRARGRDQELQERAGDRLRALPGRGVEGRPVRAPGDQPRLLPGRSQDRRDHLPVLRQRRHHGAGAQERRGRLHLRRSPSTSSSRSRTRKESRPTRPPTPGSPSSASTSTSPRRRR